MLSPEAEKLLRKTPAPVTSEFALEQSIKWAEFSKRAVEPQNQVHARIRSEYWLEIASHLEAGDG